MQKLLIFIVTLIWYGNTYCQTPVDNAINLQGDLKKWHKVTLVLDGPETSELDENNPFLQYRLNVTFSQGNHSYTVPGYYAADGNAAETSADSGNKWMVHFSPDRTGEWAYSVSFRQGNDIAVKEPHEGESAGFVDGTRGTFQIANTDKTGRDNRTKGRLNYVGKPYLQYAETGEYFIKAGVDAPENLLAYSDFDATPDVGDRRKTWEPHSRDYDAGAGDFLWKGDKGRNLQGAIHYLASEGLNAFSFLTFNVDGDDRNVFPHLLRVSESEYEKYANVNKNKNAWNTLIHKTRFDVSKLAQWERIFEYAETQGMFLHFKTQEVETNHLMDGGKLGKESKLYYRELIARFGHHLALNWNLGEENTQEIEEVRKTAAYIKQVDPYDHHRVIHTYPNQDDRYQQLIGDQSALTGTSLQLSGPNFGDVHPRVLKWRMKSDSTGRPWAIAVDEPGGARHALLTDEENPGHDSARVNALWGTLMAGGYGVEWYFGYASPESDLTCQDFRSRDLFWDQNRVALDFFGNDIPFWKMKPADSLTEDTRSWCLAQEGEMYVVFIPPGLTTTSTVLPESGKGYQVRWYDPREGGELQKGSITELKGGSPEPLGEAPSESDKDWVILIRKK